MNILLLQLKRIGDLVLTTPAIAAIRAHYPAAKITLVVSAGCADLLQTIEGIDCAMVARGSSRDLNVWLTLARGGFDFCVDFTRNDRSAFLTLLSRARRRITSDRVQVRARTRSLFYNELVPASVRQLHTVDYHLALLRPLGISEAPQNVRLALPAAERTCADEILRAAGVEQPFVIVHPGSARAEKFWEADRWARVIEHCASQHLQCVVTGSGSAPEQRHIAAIKAASRAPFVDLSGTIGLSTLAAVLARARLLVTVDSAPVHLAAAMSTPQVVLFGPTNPLHWRPRCTPAVVLQAGQARPLLEFTPETHGAPMNQISTQQVIDAMESLLSAPAAPAHERT